MSSFFNKLIIRIGCLIFGHDWDVKMQPNAIPVNYCRYCGMVD